MNKATYKFLFLLLFITGFFAYNGLFNPISFKNSITGPYYLVYKNHFGCHKNADTSREELLVALKSRGISWRSYFNLYFDDIRIVGENNCRSMVGVIVDDLGYKMITESSLGFGVVTFPQSEVIETTFPYPTFVVPYIAAWRVPSAFDAFLNGQFKLTGPVLEIQNSSKEEITFHYPTENIDKIQNLWE